jgi:hypothetical protein
VNIRHTLPFLLAPQNLYRTHLMQQINRLASGKLITLVLLLSQQAPSYCAELTPWLDVRAKAELNWSQQRQQPVRLGNWWQGHTGQQPQAKHSFSASPLVGALTLHNDTPFSAHVHLSYQADLSAASGITEAWLQYQPLPWSGYRFKAKAGWFYPALSVENNAVAWTSQYSSQFSVLNSWFAEELRGQTVELSLSRPGQTFSSAHSQQWIIAAFRGNDPLGSLLAWRGFARHNLQTALDGRIDFAHYPSLQRFPLQKQPAWVKPFVELDGRTGWYLGWHYQYRQQLELRWYHYDSNGDPQVLVKGQYAWDNRLNQLALQYQLNDQWRLLAQIADGMTEMGWRTVLIDYQAAYLLASYQVDSWQLSWRYDHWRQQDRDQTVGDDNNGNGSGHTLALHYQLSEQWQLQLEWSRLNTQQASRGQWQGWPVQRTFGNLLLGLVWHLP